MRIWQVEDLQLYTWWGEKARGGAGRKEEEMQRAKWFADKVTLSPIAIRGEGTKK